ncbi:hypothetical protein ACLB2K_016307 [Fragaria x ananassa]
MELLLRLCLLSLLLLSSKSISAEEQQDSEISRFLQINTARPKPLYQEAADFILTEANSLSLQSQTLEFVPGKPLVLLKWPGSDPSLPSILLNSHTDVVPAEHDKWAHHPFAAHVDPNGKIYARGSQDMKCVGLQYLEAIPRLKTCGFVPTRSVYLSFVPDEEIGGHDGAEKFAESEIFKSLNVGIVLDEGLASPSEEYRAFYAERCPWWLIIKSTGAPGHGANLYDNTAMENILKSVRRFRAAQFDLVKAGLKAEGEMVSVNMAFLKAGTPSPTLGQFKQSVSVLDKSGRPVLTATDSSNPWWALLEEVVKKANGKLGKPEIFPASTDACYFRLQGLPAIGFSPMANTSILLHDHNEFLNKDEYLKGIKIYESIIKSYSSYAEHVTAGMRDEL